MYKPTVSGIYQSAVDTGLKLFGIPHMETSKEDVLTQIKDLSGYEDKGGTGLVYHGFYAINRIKASDRIFDELGDGIENFLYIGDWEYVFFPISQERKPIDVSSERVLLNPAIREVDGNVYTVCGEASCINVIEIDVDWIGACKMFYQTVAEYLHEGWSTKAEMFDVLEEAFCELDKEVS
jgi:hypothetical protein